MVDDNKKGESKDKPSANKEELANNNSGDRDNKPSADIESLVGEKNINQNGNPNIQKLEKAKVASAVTKKVVLSNSYFMSIPIANPGRL